MRSVQDLAREIVVREGGFVDDPDDLGGATNYGVTIHTMRRLGLDLTGDGTVDTADVRALTPDIAVDLFIRDYFQKPKIALLPESVQASVFDMYVNAGSHAIRILQRLLIEMGFDLSVDGVIGPITAATAHRAQDEAAHHFADAYGIARRNYYYAIADARPASRKYARRKDGGKGGWIRRAEEFISSKYHLTEAAHRARTATWE
ncbi:holin-associated N-acetylmuramidase [Tropicimonas sp. S265A]|uniref:holin-associated N-acetylmuramidase n=1 Tax=Tropicimonas sp. S265A TaxID=3415134 RepID=UPI003C7A4E19